MRRFLEILAGAFCIAACAGAAERTAGVPSPAEPEVATDPAVADSTHRPCPPGYACITGRTGPNTARPVFVVDGVVYESTSASLGVRAALPDVAPHEIESIEVIKSVQAVERFGPRARDGAIVIRTKRGTAALPKR